MKRIIFYILIVFSVSASAQDKETFKREGISLIFINEDPNLLSEVKDGLVKTFFTTYPKLIKAFNPEALKTLEVKIDTAYKGVAFAHQGKVTISSQWLQKKPEDLNVITHEIMHIVQSYPQNSGPGWLTEGIADYARYAYGVNINSTGWFLPEFSADNHYT